MSHSDMLEILRKVVCDFVDVNPKIITPELNIRNNLKLNSLEIINLIVAIEDAFLIKISDEEIDAIETVGDILQLINAKKA